MWKYLFVLVLMLDWHSDVNLTTNSLNQDSQKAIIEYSEEFEINALGENIVASVEDYFEAGVLKHQVITYLDNSQWISYDGFEIKDLKQRAAYINYVNSHDLINYKELNTLLFLNSSRDVLSDFIIYGSTFNNSIASVTSLSNLKQPNKSNEVYEDNYVTTNKLVNVLITIVLLICFAIFSNYTYMNLINEIKNSS